MLAYSDICNITECLERVLLPQSLHQAIQQSCEQRQAAHLVETLVNTITDLLNNRNMHINEARMQLEYVTRTFIIDLAEIGIDVNLVF